MGLSEKRSVLEEHNMKILIFLCLGVAASYAAPRQSVACEVCEFAMTELEKVISDKSTEAQVIAAVEQVCNLLPASYAAKCDALVEQYGNEIIELLIHAADPSTVCTLIGL